MSELRGLIRAYVNTGRKLGHFLPSTANTYWYNLSAFAEFVDDRPVEKITRRHVEKYIEAQRADATKRAQLSSVRNFFAWAVETGKAPKDPTLGLKGPKVRRTQPKAIVADDVARIFDACPDNRGRLILSLMCNEGLRIAEVAGLRRDAIDLPSLLITVLGKGQKERVLPLSGETQDFLFAYLSECPGPSGPLIRSTIHPNRGMTPTYLSRMVRRWMLESGVKRAPYDHKSAHALRHTCATDLADAGTDIRVIADILGHADLGTVAVYTRRRQADGPLRAAIDGRRYQGRQVDHQALIRGWVPQYDSQGNRIDGAA